METNLINFNLVKHNTPEQPTPYYSSGAFTLYYNGDIYTSQERLAKLMGISLKTIQGYIRRSVERELEENLKPLDPEGVFVPFIEYPEIRFNSTRQLHQDSVISIVYHFSRPENRPNEKTLALYHPFSMVGTVAYLTAALRDLVEAEPLEEGEAD